MTSAMDIIFVKGKKLVLIPFIAVSDQSRPIPVIYISLEIHLFLYALLLVDYNVSVWCSVCPHATPWIRA